MAKGLLISYAGYPYTPSSLMPDNGLASLAGSLQRAGHEVKIIDYNTPSLVERLIPKEGVDILQKVYSSGSIDKERAQKIDRILAEHQSREVEKLSRELSETIDNENPDFVGFKLWMGDGFTGSCQMAEQIRRDHPHVRIYGGGPSAYTFKELILKKFPADAICYDEAEDTITDLARHSEGKTQLSEIPNIIYKNGSGNVSKTRLNKILELDRLEYPCYESDVYPSMGNEQKMKIYTLDESRGCINSCPFCIQDSREDNRFRTKSVERIVTEIQRLHDSGGADTFRLGGQMTPGRLLEGLSRELIKRRLSVMLSCFGYTDSLKNTDFDLLYEGGLRAVFYGIESGNKALLRGFFKKNTNLENAKDVINRTKKAGIKASFSLIYPASGESEETKKDTLKFIEDTRPDSVLIYFPGIYPHTEWANHAEDYGFKITSDNYAEEILSYKIKNIFPPSFWDPLHYEVGGRDFRQFSKETGDFAGEVASRGIQLYLADEHFLMALKTGMNANKLSSEIREMFFLGDKGKVDKLVSKINNGL